MNAALAEKGVRGKGRQPFSPLSPQRPRRVSTRRLRATFLTHRIATHFDAMRVVDEPVEDAIGQRRIADLFVPACDGQLRGEDHRSRLITVFADLPEVPALGLTQWSHDPVIDYQ